MKTQTSCLAKNINNSSGDVEFHCLQNVLLIHISLIPEKQSYEIVQAGSIIFIT